VNYFSYVLSPATAWLMVIISLDRFLNVAYPRRFPLFSNKIFQFTLSLIIILYNYIYYSFTVWNSYLVPVYDVIEGTNGT
jgi:hypothetical protein